MMGNSKMAKKKKEKEIKAVLKENKSARYGGTCL